MIEFKAYHKIKQFKDVVRAVRLKADFRGVDDQGEPIYESSIKPTITFKGTVKLHGTNAGIVYSPDTGIIAQKRSSVIGKEDHIAHFGFNWWVQVKERDNLIILMESLWKMNKCGEGDQITLYGEWAGENIQKGVGISKFPKAFYTFDCKVYNPVTKEERWVDISGYEYSIKDMFNIHEFTTFKIAIDFNKPEQVQNQLIKLTELVEKECPVAGEGIGEGIVWTGFWEGEKYIFKVKGEKHSTTKVKKLASVDPEKLSNIQQFVEYAVTLNRVEQAVSETGAKDRRDTPEFLRWIANDIISEESDTLVSNNLEWKDVAKYVTTEARNMFFSIIDKL